KSNHKARTRRKASNRLSPRRVVHCCRAVCSRYRCRIRNKPKLHGVGSGRGSVNKNVQIDGLPRTDVTGGAQVDNVAHIASCGCTGNRGTVCKLSSFVKDHCSSSLGYQSLVRRKRVATTNGDFLEHGSANIANILNRKCGLLYTRSKQLPQLSTNVSGHVKHRPAQAQLGNAFDGLKHKIRQPRPGRCRGRSEVGHSDVAGAHNRAPISKCESSIPTVVRTIRLHSATVTINVFDGHLPLIGHLQAGFGALRDDAVYGIRSPHDEPDAGIVGTRTARWNDVISVFGKKAAVASSKTRKPFRVYILVAVQYRIRHCLVPAFNVGTVSGETKFRRIAV